MRNIDVLLNQKTFIEQCLDAHERSLSVYHFSSIFLWQDFFDFDIEMIEGCLCIFARQPRTSFMYLPPLKGRITSSVLDACFSRMDAVNPRTARIENVEQSQLPFFDSRYRAYAKASEYVYHRQDLVDLKGHAYKSQRHDIHHFQLHHSALFRPYEESDAKECLGLYAHWARARHEKNEDEIYRQMLQENQKVHELAMFFYRQLGLRGYVVEIDGKIEAYSFGYSLNNDIFCVLLEITNTQRAGLSAYIFNRVCAHDAQREFKLINTMDDFGLPLVAASKEAYHPIFKPVAYTISRN